MEFSGIEKMSFVDWDNKIVATLFTRGCNFRCPFCHNGFLVQDPDKCEQIPFDTILEYLKKRKNMLEGVVISGGEPTLMPDLKEKIKEIRSLGYKIKLDTNGTNPDVLKDLVNSKLVDYVAMDIKNSLQKYAETAGVLTINTSKIKESIDFLKTNIVNYEFRTTIVKEFHNEESIEELGKLIAGATKIYLQHFKNVDSCICHDLHDIDKKTATNYIHILSKYVGSAKLRGY